MEKLIEKQNQILRAHVIMMGALVGVLSLLLPRDKQARGNEFLSHVKKALEDS